VTIYRSVHLSKRTVQLPMFPSGPCDLVDRACVPHSSQTDLNARSAEPIHVGLVTALPFGFQKQAVSICIVPQAMSIPMQNTIIMGATFVQISSDVLLQIIVLSDHASRMRSLRSRSDLLMGPDLE